MKWLRCILGLGFLLVVMVGCGSSPDSPALTGTPNPPAYGHPLKRGKAAHMALEEIDSLMWQQPDSALAVMMEFAGSTDADSRGEFEGHYCQVLVAELLYKNDYGQSNREDVLQAVAYFDSLVCGDPPLQRGAGGLKHTPPDLNDDLAFLTARSHYINGVGYYEHDSLVEACGEYLCALRMMESHFAEKDLLDKKARFMALTYNRLLDIFRYQLMPEPAIFCAKQSLAYSKIAPTSKYGEAILYSKIGLQYDVLEEPDSAGYYHDKALEVLPDRNSLAYRDMVSSWAYFQHNPLGHTQIALDSLKSLVAKATDESERITRYMSIGMVYVDIGQYDSAKRYMEPVFEKDPNRAIVVAKCLNDIALSEGDTLKANEYALALADVGASAADNQLLVSKLNDLFQSYLQEKQEAASLRERREAVRMTLIVLVPLLVAIGLAVAFVIRRRGKQQMAAQQAEAQKALEEQDRHHIEAIKKQQDEALQQARTMLPQRVNDLYRSKVSNRMERIMAEFEAAYPGALGQLAEAHPDLTETERQIAVLNFLQFRAKEEADLLGFAENTIMKYRSNLNKKAGSDPISALI